MAAAEDRLPVRNPRTGDNDYWITPPSPKRLHEICQELRAAQVAWGARPLAERIAVMLRWADAIERHAQAIGDAEAIDTGRWKLSHQVPHMVVDGIRGWCKSAPALIDRALLSGTSTIYPNVSFQSQLKPIPLLGVISPWNHPFLLATLDAIPALIAGCAVVVKPSEIAPRFVEPVQRTVDDVPELAAVLRFITGDGRTGQALIEEVDALCFTGSVGTGRKVAVACANRFIPAFLEMGGKDAAVVTATADLDRAATAVLRSSVFATGQICFSTERVYVHESVHDAFVQKLVEKSNQLELSYPDPRRGHIGPFTFVRQAAIVDAHIDDALAQGARLACGGKSEQLGGGHYMRATVLTEVTHAMKVMTEETFGPVTPVMRYRTEEEAIALANDSDYGLSAAVIAGDVEEARRIGERLDAGAVALQDAGITIAILRDAEKNSFNLSGMGGSRMGPNGLLRFYRKKALMANHAAPADMLALGEA
ncbi:aldehyde dehydrogenase family protein [Ramlibacter sp. AW1]|uniref:Aldehyde dehydrogenase family protein n=1 Tax=Ramlibacter aurantiacus TaxID=2801330 RepID=A0A936ZPQ3_9BURK|nr:aldehyde dehydrogenase family protein [Ramlibacter aurantiacus]MBL0421471.1 aldehyde dehydrogenase family protein [Ramlibacter aurantiacus]